MFVFLTYKGESAGTVGLAWIGTICFPDSAKGYKAGINECFTKDLTSAEVKTFFHFHIFLFNSLNFYQNSKRLLHTRLVTIWGCLMILIRTHPIHPIQLTDFVQLMSLFALVLVESWTILGFVYIHILFT